MFTCTRSRDSLVLLALELHQATRLTSARRAIFTLSLYAPPLHPDWFPPNSENGREKEKR